MPLIPIAIAGALGFGGGFIASDGLKTLGRMAIVGGAAYLIYTKVK